MEACQAKQKWKEASGKVTLCPHSFLFYISSCYQECYLIQKEKEKYTESKLVDLVHLSPICFLQMTYFYFTGLTQKRSRTSETVITSIVNRQDRRSVSTSPDTSFLRTLKQRLKFVSKRFSTRKSYQKRLTTSVSRNHSKAYRS